MNIIYSNIFDGEYKTLGTKALKSLKMPLLLGFLKYVSEEELSEEKLLEYIELNKNKVQNVWIDEYKKYLKELKDAISQKCMVKREIGIKIKELKSEKEDKVDPLQWKLKIEKISMRDDGVDEYFQKMKLDEIKKDSKKEIDKINESIIIEKWSIDNDDMMVKLKDYIKDVEEELKTKKIILKRLKVSKKGLIRLHHNTLVG